MIEFGAAMAVAYLIIANERPITLLLVCVYTFVSV